MNQSQVLDEFRAAGALLEGHFILSSGLHSPVFFQKNAVFMDPARTERLCKALAEKARAAFGKVEVVVSTSVRARCLWSARTASFSCGEGLKSSRAIACSWWRTW